MPLHSAGDADFAGNLPVFALSALGAVAGGLPANAAERSGVECHAIDASAKLVIVANIASGLSEARCLSANPCLTEPSIRFIFAHPTCFFLVCFLCLTAKFLTDVAALSDLLQFRNNHSGK